MESKDERILELFRRLSPEQQTAFLNASSILAAGVNGQTACPAARTEKGRELLRLVRETGSPFAALQLSMELIAESLDRKGGPGDDGL